MNDTAPDRKTATKHPRPQRGGRNGRPADQAANAPTRRQEIIEAAAECFARRGYDATTMRDIAARTGMMAGSIYYHFASKEDLLIAVHEEAIRRIRTKVIAAIRPGDDPWTRLYQACSRYIETLISERKFAEVVITEFPRRRANRIRSKLVAHREPFEQVFQEIVDELPLAPGVDRSIWRLALLSMMAWTMVWYRKGKKSPQQIAHELVDLLRNRTAADQA